MSVRGARLGAPALIAAAALALGCGSAARDADALADRGLRAARAGRYAEARAIFERALARDADNPKALFNLGTVHLALEQWTLAARNFERFVELRPNDADARFELARTRAFAGDPGGALDALEAAVARGFRDYDRLVADGAFGRLYLEPRYVALEVTVAQRAGVPPDRGALAGDGAPAARGAVALPGVRLPGAGDACGPEGGR